MHDSDFEAMTDGATSALMFGSGVKLPQADPQAPRGGRKGKAAPKEAGGEPAPVAVRGPPAGRGAWRR